MIETRGLTRKFKETTAVDQIDFKVRPGRTTGFVGPNGSGKTTVLRLCCALIRPTSGKVLIAGMDPETNPLAVRRKLSYLPGETSLYIHMKGREYLSFMRKFRSDPDLDLENDLLQLFDLPLDRKIRTYSAGMKQKLALCSVLTAGVPLYLLDEPARTLDATMRNQLIRALELLRQRERTIFLSSHHLGEIEKVCDDIIFLMNGKVIPPERIKEVQQDLSSLVRVKLTPGVAPEDLKLPAIYKWESKYGMLCISTPNDPRELLKHLAEAPIDALFWGRADLAEIYDQLYLNQVEA